MAGFDVNQIKGNDRIIAGAGIVVFIASFFHWFGFASYHQSGWNTGALAVLGILLSLAATVFVVLRSTGQMKDAALPTGPAVLLLGLTAGSLVFLLLRFLFAPGYGPFHLTREFGLYLALIGSAVQTGFAFLAFRASGEKLPGTAQGPSSPPHPAP